MTDIRDSLRSGPRKSRRQIQDQYRTLIRQAGELVEGMDAATFNRRPAGGGWSVAECMDHLNATARLYVPTLTSAIEDGRARGITDGQPGKGRTILGRLATWSQEPPPRFRMKTFSELRPQTDLDRESVLEEFVALHEEIIVRINESGDLDRGKVKVRSPLDRRLRLSLEDWYWFLAAHARRHLWQAATAAYGPES